MCFIPCQITCATYDYKNMLQMSKYDVPFDVFKLTYININLFAIFSQVSSLGFFGLPGLRPLEMFKVLN